MSALNMPEHLIESFPLIRTTSYRRVVLEEQICFLEQIHPLVQDLQHAEERVAIAQRVLAHARKQAQSIWNKRIAQARKAVNEAEKRVRESTRAMHDANERFSQAQDRLEALRQGRLSPEDNQRILRAMESAVEPYDREIESMEIAKQDLQSRISQLRRTHEQLTRELAEVEEEHRAWSQGLLPPRVEEAVVSAMKKAESAHAAEVEKLHKEIERMSQKRIAESEKAENLRAKLVRLEEEVAALKRQQEGGFPSWLCSLFSTFMYDPRREHEAVQRQLDAVTARVNDLKVKLESHTQKWQELVSQKDGWIDQAAREEKERQYQNFRERRSRLARELGDCQQSLESCSSELSNVEQRLTEAHENREKVMESARTQAWNSLLEEAENEVIEGKQACDRAQRETELARQLSENAAKAYQELMAAEAEFFQCELAEYHRELDQTLAECEALRQQIAKQMSDHGIAPPEPLNFPNLLGLRDSLQQEHESLMTGQKANNRPPLVRRVIRRDVQAFEEEIFASGQLYLDFECNANDYLDRDGENWPGLLGQLQEIRRRHRGLLFPDLSEDADLLEAFLAMFFPEDIVRDYFVANISLSDERVFLMIRPAVITPRMEAALPAGVILAICGRLHDHRVNSDNPVLLVQRIVELSPCRQRPFEGRIRVKTVTSTDMIYPGRKRQNNVLTQAFIEALPPISRQTKQRLQEWEEYLDWKEQLVKCKLDGVRYLTRDLVMKGASPRIRFLIVAENSEAFDSSKRVLKQSELAAFGLDYSLNPWRFEYNENHRSAACELGDFVTLEAGKAGGSDKLVQDVPWPQPGWGWALFRLSERMQLLFEEWQEAGRELGHIEQTILKEVPQEGFLSFSVVGDIALIKRQRSALKKLEKQSGFAPLLSSYLFDIKAADEPAELITIADDEWFRKDLNADQRLAVRKMISAPDLALVQGPPGTGKTTMIAEAIWQFVRRGECVLVASQANLAVDNALERLAEAPEIRAIRLGSRVDEDCPYHRKQVLHTYYRAISRACSQRILQRWQDMDKLERELSAWLDSLNMVAADLEALHNNEQKLLAELKDIQQKIEAAYERERQRRDQEQQQQRVKRFLDFLEGREPLCENIPKEFRTVLLSELHPLLDKLENSGIVLDKQGSVWSAVSSGEQCLILVEVLKRWRDIESLIPRLESDLLRLQSLDTETILSREDALRLQELQTRARKLQEEMVEDASKLTDWQAVQREIRELKKNGSGLDRELYQQIFSGEIEGTPAFLLFTRPESQRVEVMERLQAALSVFHEVHQAMAGLCDRCRSIAESLLAPIEPDTESVEDLEQLHIARRDANQRLQTLQENIERKEASLAEVIRERWQNGGQQPSHADFACVRDQAARELAAIRRFLAEQKVIREAWEPILNTWVKELKDQATAVRDEQDFLPVYMDACNVVGVTCTENPRTLESEGFVRFDVAIIDEVSKATPPEIIMPLMLARTAILVGDHRQLPPLFRETELTWEELVAEQEGEPAHRLMTRENFERYRKMVTASLFKEHFENAPESLKAFLFTQYRMHPHIMEIINHFYEGRLECGLQDPDGVCPSTPAWQHRQHGLRLTESKGNAYLSPNEHVLWIDSSFDPLRNRHFEQRSGSGGKSNELEAMLIAKVLQDIEMSCRAMGYGSAGRPAKRVGVITFYGRQVRAIREMLRHFRQVANFEFKAIRVDINTVDRYQGQERPIVLVSLVRNPRHLLSKRANTAQFERINVAFSRAQELLLIFGAEEAFAKYPVRLPHLDRPGFQEVRVYRYIIDVIKRNGGFRRAEEVISRDLFRKLRDGKSR